MISSRICLVCGAKRLETEMILVNVRIGGVFVVTYYYCSTHSEVETAVKRLD